MISLNREELAWAAGFYEGEGCISSDKTLRPRIFIHQVGREPLDKFRDVVGCGMVRGPYGPPVGSPNRQPIHSYELEGFTDVQALVAMIWSWLSERRQRQAVEILNRYLTRVLKPNKNASKTHCAKGHPFTPDNIYPGAMGSRRCRTCHRQDGLRRRQQLLLKLSEEHSWKPDSRRVHAGSDLYLEQCEAAHQLIRVQGLTKRAASLVMGVPEETVRRRLRDSVGMEEPA